MNRAIRLILWTDGRVMDSSKHCSKRATFYPVHVISAKTNRSVTLDAVHLYHSYYLIESNSLVLFLLAIRMVHHLYFLPVVLEFRWILSSGLSSQASGKRRTVTIAQEVKGPVAIDLNLSAEDSNS